MEVENGSAPAILAESRAKKEEKGMKIKKVIALTMAATMALAPMTALAEDTPVTDPEKASGSITGSGEMEYVNKKVFSVTLPTTTDDSVNFTVDPQGILAVKDAVAYTLGPGALYFANYASDGSVTYSNETDPSVIVNRSSYDVDVSFGVDVTLPDGITLAEKADDLTDATTPTIYLAMQEAGDDAATALASGTNAADTKLLAGVAEDTTNSAKADATGYIVLYDPNTDTFSYEYGDKVAEADLKKASYTLTGSCDKTADWSTVSAAKDNTIGLKITWSVAEHTDKPTLSANTVSSSSNTVTITDLKNAKTVSGVTITTTSGSEVTLASGTKWSYNATTQVITFTASVLSGNVGGTLHVKFDDGSVVDIAVK